MARKKEIPIKEYVAICMHCPYKDCRDYCERIRNVRPHTDLGLNVDGKKGTKNGN